MKVPEWKLLDHLIDASERGNLRELRELVVEADTADLRRHRRTIQRIAETIADELDVRHRGVTGPR